MIVGCVGGGSNFAGAIYDFLDEPSISKIEIAMKLLHSQMERLELCRMKTYVTNR